MKILLVDDHALIREALRDALATLVAEAVFLLEADAAGAIRQLDEHPDLALAVLDLGLPDRDGFEVLASFRERSPTLATVVLSASETREDIVHALELGALGFVPKSASRKIMIDAFRLVLDGGIYVPLQALPLHRAADAHPPPPPSRPFGLTERQREVLDRLMRGMSNKAICRDLGIAEATVKNHVTEILRATGARNRTEAVIVASAGPDGTEGRGKT